MLYNPLFLHFLRGILNAINRNLEGIKMAVSNIKAIFENDIHKVWDIVFAVDKYSSWRSDLSKTEIMNEKQFIEYTKDGYATTFSITAVEPYRRWEFDMENSNMAGHWIGVFMAKGNKTQVDFTENVICLLYTSCLSRKAGIMRCCLGNTAGQRADKNSFKHVGAVQS